MRRANLSIYIYLSQTITPKETVIIENTLVSNLILYRSIALHHARFSIKGSEVFGV